MKTPLSAKLAFFERFLVASGYEVSDPGESGIHFTQDNRRYLISIEAEEGTEDDFIRLSRVGLLTFDEDKDGPAVHFACVEVSGLYRGVKCLPDGNTVVVSAECFVSPFQSFIDVFPRYARELDAAAKRFAAVLALYQLDEEEDGT